MKKIALGLVLVFAAAKSFSQSDGSYINVWSEEEGGNFYVYAQHYDREGNPLSEKISVSGGKYDYNMLPWLSGDNSGNFVVVWVATNNYDYDWIVLYRVYDLEDRGGEIFEIKGPRYAAGPLVSIAPFTGRFAISWVDWDYGGHFDLYLQQFGSGGRPLGDFKKVDEGGSSTMNMLATLMADEEEIKVGYRTEENGPVKEATEEWLPFNPVLEMERRGEDIVLRTAFLSKGMYVIVYCSGSPCSGWMELTDILEIDYPFLEIVDEAAFSEKKRFYRAEFFY